MTVKIGINGFGRIGRLAFRRIFELQEKGGEANDIEVAAINDLTTPSMLAYLLKYDSSQGPFRHADGTPVKVSSTDTALVVEGKEYPVYAEKDASNIPWVANNGVEYVLECTGFYTSAEKSRIWMPEQRKSLFLPLLKMKPPRQSYTASTMISSSHQTASCLQAPALQTPWQPWSRRLTTTGV